MLRPNQKLGKYRIERKLQEGGFATVYRALDTIEGLPVALKVPHLQLLTPETLEDFRREVRLAAKLRHPNILPLKNADFIEGRFVISFPLGERTLADRLQNRLSTSTALKFADQMIQAVAYAHGHRIIHCDIKPGNLIIFPDNTLMLADFGIAKVALRTIRASGSGTLGYIAPEQAMGKPSFRSDVFSLGLILYRMLAGHLPEWPFVWPPPGYARLRARVHPDLIELLRRAISVDPRKRFRDAGSMLSALRRVRPRAVRRPADIGARRAKGAGTRDWVAVRRRQFVKQFGQVLETHFHCPRCEGPVSESMTACPWCGTARGVHHDETRFPQRCPRCHRGLKLDWNYCPWCYGPGFQVRGNRQYSDARYTGRCANADCSRKLLMPFMRYCPWCHRKVRRKWKLPGSTDKCPCCGWGVAPAFWSFCPWCGKHIAAPSSSRT